MGDCDLFVSSASSNLATAKKRNARARSYGGGSAKPSCFRGTDDLHCTDDLPRLDRPIPRSTRAAPNPTPTDRGEHIAGLVDSWQCRKRRVPSHDAIQVRDYLDLAGDIRPGACVGLRSGLES